MKKETITRMTTETGDKDFLAEFAISDTGEWHLSLVRKGKILFKLDSTIPELKNSPCTILSDLASIFDELQEECFNGLTVGLPKAQANDPRHPEGAPEKN